MAFWKLQKWPNLHSKKKSWKKIVKFCLYSSYIAQNCFHFDEIFSWKISKLQNSNFSNFKLYSPSNGNFKVILELKLIFPYWLKWSIWYSVYWLKTTVVRPNKGHFGDYILSSLKNYYSWLYHKKDQIISYCFKKHLKILICAKIFNENKIHMKINCFKYVWIL